MAYIGSGLTRFNTADDLTVTDDAEIGGDLTVTGSADINGGTIDGVTIGGASAGAGTFTTVTGSGDMNIDSGTLFVDASENRVGIGTSSPIAPLDTVIAGDGVSAYFRSSGSSSALNINHSSNLVDFATGSNDVITFSPAGTERARIDSSGRLLVGTTNASGSVGEGIKIYGDGFLGVVASDARSDSYNYYNTTAGAYRFYVQKNGTINATNTTISAISDARLKENIRDLDVGLSEIMQLQPRVFDWKAGKGKDTQNDRGFIAQEFEQVFPNLIDEWKDPSPEGEEPYKSVRQDLIPVLVKAIQEQQATIETLETTQADLIARIEALEAN